MLDISDEIYYPKLSEDMSKIKAAIEEPLTKSDIKKLIQEDRIQSGDSKKKEISDFDLPIDNPWDMLRLLMKPDKFHDSKFHQTITKEFITSNIRDRLSRAKVDADFATMMSLQWHGSQQVWKIYHARMMETMLLSSAEGIIPWIEGSTGGMRPVPQPQPPPDMRSGFR